MRLVIELDSSELVKAVENQVGQVVSKLTQDIIMKKIDEIIPLKVERISEKRLEDLAIMLLDQHIKSYCSEQYIRQNVNTEIVKSVKKALKP